MSGKSALSGSRDHIERLFKVVQMCSVMAAIAALGIKAHSAVTLLVIPLGIGAWFFAISSVLDYLIYLEEEGEEAALIIKWVKRKQHVVAVEFSLIMILIFGMLGFTVWLTVIIFTALPK